MKRILLAQRLILSLLLLSLAGIASAKSACSCLIFQPYLGLEYQYTHIKPRLNYQNILSADVQSANFFAGTKFHKYFGLEIGYYRSLHTAQQQDVVNGFGDHQASNVTALLTRTSFKGFSIDLDVYYALDPKFNIYAIFGFVTMHPTIDFEAWNGTDLAAAFPLITVKNRTVPKLGFGLELLEQHWGIRTRLSWLYTQNMKFDVKAAREQFHGITSHPYMQSIQATAGIFYRF